MSAQPIRVLLVEDNPTDVLILQEVLARVSSAQFELIHAERLVGALAYLSREPFDVVLLDLGLPDSQGLETLVKLRQQAPPIPVVVLTGLADEALGLNTLQQGAQDYLVKGQVEGDGLARAIRYAIKRKQAEEEIRQRNRELTLFNQVIAACAADIEVETMLEIACRELALAFEVPQATAALFDEKKTLIQIVAEYRASGQPSALGLTFPVLHDPALQYLLKQEGPLIVSEVQSDPRLTPSFRELLGQGGIVSLMILPLRFSGEIVGSLMIEAGEPRLFSAKDVNLAWSVADQVAGSLARARLVQTQQRLSAAIEQAMDTVIITTTSGVIIYVNPAFERNSGYSRAEAVGQTPQLLKSDQHDPDFYEVLWTTLRAGQVWRGRFVNKRKDDALYTEDATITPIRNDNGAITNYVSVQHDVTRELQLEEQYRQSQKMEAIGRLSGGVAHDFNNLLLVINGYSELLLNRYLDIESPLRKHVEEIQKAGERAAGLTNQLLAFSRKQVLEPKVLNLNTIVAEMDKMLRRLIGEDIDLVTALRDGLGQVKADPGQLEQVLLNLAVNARDAMPQGGKLTIETANIELDDAYARQHAEVQSGHYVMLAVSDTGSGIDRETLARIYEPFFTTKAQGKGTGLGLSTVYGIVKQSGGHIWVYSELGRGTTFKVYLPRVQETVEVVEPDPARLEQPQGLETILLVEDDERVRELVRTLLEEEGYTVLVAHNGDEALRFCQQYDGPAHLLVTDIVMPGGINGRQLSERLAPLYPELKVLFMSGYTDEAIVHHGVLEHHVAFLQKPFTLVALLRKVREILDASLSR